MDDNLSTVKSILDLKFEITQLRIDLNVVQEQCRLLLCSSTKFHKDSKEWDFDILNKMITTNLNSIKSHTQAIEDINIHLTNIDTQYDLITKKDIIDYKSLMERWDNFDNVLAEHAQSLEALSYRVSLCDCQTLYNKVEDLAGKLNKINDSIPDFAGLTKLVNETSDQFKTSISDIETIKTNINLINSAIDGLPDYGNSVQSLDDTLKMLTDKVNEYDGQYTDIEKKYNDLQVRFGNLDNTLTLFKCSIDEQKKKNEEQDRVIQELYATICDLKGQVSDTSSAPKMCDVWPIGSIFISVNNIPPDTLLGCGIWEQIKDVFLLSAGKLAGGLTGGEENHTLIYDELPHIAPAIPLDVNIATKYNFTNPTSTEYVYDTGCKCTEIDSYVDIMNIKDFFEKNGQIYYGNLAILNRDSGIVPFSFIPKGSKNIEIWLHDQGKNDDLQILTLDGYHLSGTRIGNSITWDYVNVTDSNVNDRLITYTNGFNSDATYKIPSSSSDLRGSFNDGLVNSLTTSPTVEISKTPSNYRSVTYYRSANSSARMTIGYTGDFNKLRDNDYCHLEYVRIDNVIEDLLLFTTGLDLNSVIVKLGYIPDRKFNETLKFKYNLYNIDSFGKNQSHNNMPPYLTVYMWKRVA